MSIPVSFYTATENDLVKDDDWMTLVKDDDWMIDKILINDGYEEIYNREGRTAGEVREYMGRPGRFYQTYGNGGGPGGWGGYWIRDGGEAVWKVEGNDFTYMDGKTLLLHSVPYFPASLHWWCKLVPR